jgi:hypothetical protein
MENTPRLAETLVDGVPPQHTWLDRRHRQTLAWMTVGLLQGGHRRLTAWAPSGHRRAGCAQSPVRRCARGLAHDRMAGHALEGPLSQPALAAWGTRVLDRALETSRVWAASGLGRLARGDRGRAVPRVWTVWAHPRRRVPDAVSTGLRANGAERRPVPCRVVLTAARGCADTPLMPHRRGWGGPWRRRMPGRCGLARPGPRHGQGPRRPWCPGQARCGPHVARTTPA